MKKIDPATISVNYIKKEPFSGGFKGMRYQLVKSGDDMEVTIWPEPYNYFHTPEEKKQRKGLTFRLEVRIIVQVCKGKNLYIEARSDFNAEESDRFAAS